MKQSPGSVFIAALMMIALIVVLAQQLIQGVFVGSCFARTMVDREHAEALALGGISIAAVQLEFKEGADDDQDEQKEEVVPGQETKAGGPPADKAAQDGQERDRKKLKKFLSKNMPHLNRWQVYKLTQDVDGIDAQIKICISCEQGKIDINQAFDFKKQEFKKEYEAFLKGLEVRGKLPAGEIFNALTNYFKQRKRMLDDISELSAVPGLESLNIFYRPPSLSGKEGQGRDVALQDIFTIYSSNGMIDPVWFSDALCAIFGVRRPQADDAVTRKDSFTQFAEQFKKEMVQDWETNWPVLQGLYDIKPVMLSDIKKLFSKEFGPKVFSVVSCAKVGNVEQTLLAVIRRSDKPEKDKASQDKEKQKSAQQGGRPQAEEDAVALPPVGMTKDFQIIKIYWI